ncbi:MAG: hypothetical protein ACOCV2_09020 [Persicimonas sp.]
MNETRNDIASIWFLALVLAVALGPSVGCGGTDDPGGSNSLSNSESNADEESRSPTIEILIDPARSVYRTSARLTPEAQVYDADGERVSDASIEWEVTPEELYEEQNGSYELVEQGRLTFEACAEFEEAGDEPLCGSKDVLVDDAAPSLEITEPEAGAWLDADDDPVEVRGNVVDRREGEQVSVFLNGEKVSLDEDDSFSREIDSEFGINHVEAVVVDEAQHTEEARLDYIWAPEWYDMDNTEETTGFGFDDGLVLDLGQNFFDDGDPPTEADEETYITSDLADIFSLLVENIDFMDQIPDPVLDGSSGELRITDIEMGQPEILLDLVDGGLELFVWVPDLDLETEGDIAFEDTNLNLDGGISADLAGFAQVSVDKPSSDDPFEADVEAIELSLQQPESDFESDEANAVFELAESAMRKQIEDSLVDTLADQFVDQLPAIVVDALNEVDSQLEGGTFAFDTDFTGAMNISFDGGFEEFELRHRDSMFAQLGTDLSLDQAPHFEDSPGIPLAQSVDSQPELFDSSRAQVGVRLGLLNGLLHTLWQAGLLEINLTEVIPSDVGGSVEAADLSGKLQPMITPPEKGEPYDFMLRAGQLELEIDVADQVDVYAVHVEVGVTMTLDDNELALNIPDDPRVRTWLVETDADRAFIGKDMIRELILDDVWPELEESISDGLAFELPIPQPEGLGSLAPGLEALELALVLERSVDYRTGYIIFDAMLEGML